MLKKSIFKFCCNPQYIVKVGTVSPIRHLDHLEHTKKKPIVEASNNNGLKLAKCLISTSKLYALYDI